MIGFTTDQILALTRINLACSALSFVGSLFVIFCYLYFKSVRTFAFKLVFLLAISDAGFAVSYFMDDPLDNTPLCTIQAVVTSFFSVASVLCM